MIWLWLTCFSLLLAPGSLRSNLTGRVSLRDSKEKAVERERNYAGVVVWRNWPRATFRSRHPRRTR